MNENVLLNREQFTVLTKRSNRKGWLQLAHHSACLSTTALFVTVTRDGMVLIPALFLHGVVLVFLFAALHETIHRTPFKSRRLNDRLATVCGFLLLLPPQYFRAFHLAHHRHTQNPAQDPELARPKPASIGAYLWYVSGIPYWVERIKTLITHGAGLVNEPFIASHHGSAIVREARIFLSIYALLGLTSLIAEIWAMVLLLYWIIPALLAQPVLRLFMLAEHSGCPLIPNMLANSRTTHSTWLMRRLSWNMSYHAEHHAYPALPFHTLPQAHRLLRQGISTQASGYLAFHCDFLMTLMKGHKLHSENI